MASPTTKTGHLLVGRLRSGQTRRLVQRPLDTYDQLLPGLDEAAADALDAGARGILVGLGPSEAWAWVASHKQNVNAG